MEKEMEGRNKLWRCRISRCTGLTPGCGGTGLARGSPPLPDAPQSRPEAAGERSLDMERKVNC